MTIDYCNVTDHVYKKSEIGTTTSLRYAKKTAESMNLSTFVLTVVMRVLNSVLECCSAVGFCLQCLLFVECNIVIVITRVFFFAWM